MATSKASLVLSIFFYNLDFVRIYSMLGHKLDGLTVVNIVPN